MTDWSTPAIDARRHQYATTPLALGDLDPDPVRQFWQWFTDADAAGVTEPHAMILSTVDETGTPDARVVLARGVTSDGIVFYTNYDSAKSRQLDATPKAAVTFAWLPLHRQIRARGVVERVSQAESDAYFASRPRASQIGAWASRQSQPLNDRADLDAAVASTEKRFAEQPVPRPPFWGGWRIVAGEWEFWQGRPDRLHDRFVYQAHPDDGTFERRRLNP